VRSLAMSRPEEILSCYRWLYSKPISGLTFNGAQMWIWSQLHWLLRNLEACSRTLKHKDMLVELREAIREGRKASPMGDWREH